MNADKTMADGQLQMAQLDEREVRRMRDAIYGYSSGEEWAKCRDNWMRPEEVKWLREHQPKGSGATRPAQTVNTR